MLSADKILYEGDSKFDHYQVIDMVYVGRQARVLFSGQRAAAQSGIPKDGNNAMLFDYNQRFLELTLYLKPESILLIGGGAFTLPAEILKFLPKVKIDVVERDPNLKKISERFFDLKPHKNLNIIVAVNVISTYQGMQPSIIKQHYATYSSVFRHVDVYPADKTLSLWISQNFLQISTDRRINPKYKLRFEKLKAPQFDDTHILRD
jgi:hypothetical protein